MDIEAGNSMNIYRCSNCGKPEEFGPLCAACEELACETCGCIGDACDCVAIPLIVQNLESEDDQITAVAYDACLKILGSINTERRSRVMILLLLDFESASPGFVMNIGNDMNEAMNSAESNLRLRTKQN